MINKSFGLIISTLRKQQGMTQSELTKRMGVTDKAVSKQERDISYPDVSTLPKLVEIFNISIDELMQIKVHTLPNRKLTIQQLGILVLKVPSLAMGVGVVTLSILSTLYTKSLFIMLGFDLSCLALISLSKE